MHTPSRRGYYALTIAILNQCMPEMAFEKIENPKSKRTGEDESKEVDIIIWTRMRKEGIGYSEIADLFCTSCGCVYNRLKRKGAML